jgi:hypothetical protein
MRDQMHFGSEPEVERLQVWQDRIDGSLAVVRDQERGIVRALRISAPLEDLEMPAIAFRACFRPTGFVIGQTDPDGPPSLAVGFAMRVFERESADYIRAVLAEAERRGYDDLAKVARQALALRGASEAA